MRHSDGSTTIVGRLPARHSGMLFTRLARSLWLTRCWLTLRRWAYRPDTWLARVAPWAASSPGAVALAAQLEAHGLHP